MEYMIWFYQGIGALFCHQLPERTLYLQGIPLPMCARDTGIYLGVFLSAVYLFVQNRFNADKPPRIFQAVLLCFLMLPMAADGVSSYLGFRETDNVIRIFTGMFFGLSIPFFLVPAANFKIYGKNSKAVIWHTGEIFLLGVIGGSVCWAVLNLPGLPWGVVAGSAVMGFVFLIARLAFTFVYRSLPMKKERLLWPVSILTLGVLIFLHLVSSYLLQPLKYLLLKE